MLAVNNAMNINMLSNDTLQQKYQRVATPDLFNTESLGKKVSLYSLPIGSAILVKLPSDYVFFNKDEILRLVKSPTCYSNRSYWFEEKTGKKISESYIKQLQKYGSWVLEYVKKDEEKNVGKKLYLVKKENANMKTINAEKVEKNTNKEEILAIEVGVAFTKETPREKARKQTAIVATNNGTIGKNEFDYYSCCNPKLDYAFFNENSFFTYKKREEAKKLANEYCEKGVENTYAIIAEPTEKLTDEDIVHLKREDSNLDDFSFYKDKSYIIHSYIKKNGKVCEGFLEKILDELETKEKTLSKTNKQIKKSTCER